MPATVLVCCACAGLPLTAVAQETPSLRRGPTPQAPPPAAPVETRPPDDTVRPQGDGLTLYSIGQPTDEEQLYLEYINRSRADPPAEGVRLANTTDTDVLGAYLFFGVNLAQMQAEFNTNPPVAPVAMNAQLMAAARLHSGDMFTNQFQGHNSWANGWNPGQRITAQGYNWSTYGENVFAYAEHVFHGHASFNVDWGSGPGGMQSPRGHRNTIHNGNFREVGIGIVNGINGPVGPQLVTQDFGTRQSATPLITGVAYYDFNGNNFYDLGEGIGGVVVNVTNSSFYAVTSDSGGFAVPVASNGSYTVTFAAAGVATTQRVISVTSLRNIKVDYIPVYSPPVISGPNPAGLNLSNLYTFTAVGAATGYQWEQRRLSPYTAVEGAENDLTNVTVLSSPGYSIIVSDVKFAGTYSFHLAHPAPPTSQYLTLLPSVRVKSNSQLSFAKRLGLATSDQIARAQVSTNGGVSWETIWSQAGSGSSGEGVFSSVAVPLGAYSGLAIQVRFVYFFTSGSYYSNTGNGAGLYLDNIAISNADQLVNPVLSDIPSGTAFAFYPTNAGDYLLRVRAQILSRTLNWGPAAVISAATPPPTLQFSSHPVVAGNQVQLNFAVSNYRTGMTFQLWRTVNPAGSWTNDSSAAFQMLVTNSAFRYTTSAGADGKGFYQVRGSYPP